MRIIVIDMQSKLMSRVLERVLRQEMTDCTPIISEDPGGLVEQCRIFKPYALFLEVTPYAPWMLEERLKVCETVRRSLPECKCVLSVDENADLKLADRVTRCKKEGKIDAFIYNSTSERYLAAILDSL